MRQQALSDLQSSLASKVIAGREAIPGAATLKWVKARLWWPGDAIGMNVGHPTIHFIFPTSCDAPVMYIRLAFFGKLARTYTRMAGASAAASSFALIFLIGIAPRRTSNQGPTRTHQSGSNFCSRVTVTPKAKSRSIPGCRPR